MAAFPLLADASPYAFPRPGNPNRERREAESAVGELFWYFFLYSLLGFVLEVAFARLTRSRKPDRKCHLLLPVCPVYGVGALGILLLPGWVKASPLLLLPAGALLATLAEWGMSHFYEKAAGAAFWDYSALPLNLDGRVCLLFSLSWGLLALPLVYLVQPWAESWVEAIPGWLDLPAVLLYGGDALLSLHLLRTRGTEGLRWYRGLIPSAAR